MSTISRCFTLSLALLAMMVISPNLQAQCHSCNSQGGAGYAVPTNGAACQNCSPVAVHNVFHKMHIGLEKYKAGFRLNHSRGSAWPLPFSCWDRENYFAILDQQFATGVQVAHTLTSEYFDPETNKLNRAGEMRVGWIMQNAPQMNKQIYVYEDQTGPTIAQRVSAVRDFTGRYYGHMGQAAIATSRIAPIRIPATYQAQTNILYDESMPDPIIPLEVGESLSSTIGN